MKDYSDFEGPTDEEVEAALKRVRDKNRRLRQQHSSGQGNDPRVIGTPRKSKYPRGRFNGASLK